MGAAAATMECPKANRVPERVANLPPAERLAWLKGDEAEAGLTHKRRRELKRRWAAEAEGGRAGPSHVVIDPAAEAEAALQERLAEERNIEQMRRNSPRGTFDGDTPCGCEYCFDQRAHWPFYYVVGDGIRLSYECSLEWNPPGEEEHPAPNRSQGERTSNGEARRGGLRERESDRMWANTLTPCCEGCGRRKPKGGEGMRYCIGCRAEVIAVLTKAGWEASRIGLFLDPQDESENL